MHKDHEDFDIIPKEVYNWFKNIFLLFLGFAVGAVWGYIMWGRI